MARTRFQSPTAKEPQFCSFIFSRRPIWVFWRPKIPKRASWEKRFGGSIFSRRPIWAFWPPKSPKRASWEKVWWLDSWRVLEKILLPIGTKPYFALYILIFRASAKINNDAFPASFDEQVFEWKDPVLLFYFLKKSNFSFLAAKNPKRASWEKVWWLDSWRVLENEYI